MKALSLQTAAKINSLRVLVNIKLKYLCHLHIHLVQALIVLIMGLLEVLIANMMLICGENNIKK